MHTAGVLLMPAEHNATPCMGSITLSVNLLAILPVHVCSAAATLLPQSRQAVPVSPVMPSLSCSVMALSSLGVVSGVLLHGMCSWPLQVQLHQAACHQRSFVALKGLLASPSKHMNDMIDISFGLQRFGTRGSQVRITCLSVAFLCAATHHRCGRVHVIRAQPYRAWYRPQVRPPICRHTGVRDYPAPAGCA